MKRQAMGLVLLAGLLIAGCSDKEETKEKAEAPQTTSETKPAVDGSKETGENRVTQPIEEAKNLPPEEKEALMKTLARHVDAFNAKDLDAYMSTISKHTERNYEEERLYVKKVFDTFEAKMEPQHTVIIKYDEEKKEAYMFIVMKSITKDLQTGKEIEETTRQVMKLNKEEDGWKQTALSAMK
ncbi:hypothetical protein QYG89_11860 [Bacillus sp. B190/17]|uniref:Nuclear transport factor 2 family protein n=1 Tax=Bacillus lumedeiriae TaxID=3058829 RepID=A0ABW8IA34_9BACI